MVVTLRAQVLLASGADVDAQCHRRGFTPLLQAAQAAHKKEKEVAESAEANRTQGKTGKKKKAYPIREIVQLLLTAKADVNVAAHIFGEDAGLTPLIQFAKNGDRESVELLLAANADVNARKTSTLNFRNTRSRENLNRGSDSDLMQIFGFATQIHNYI
jgi:ankyrin repeat protein